MNRTYIIILLLTCFNFIFLQPWETKSNCEEPIDGVPFVPKKITDCTHIIKKDYKSCCHIQLEKSGVKTNICVLFDKADQDTILVAQGVYISQSYTADINCPEPSHIPNTCGVIGMMEPIDVKNCSLITIPESNCCLVKVTKGNDIYSACRRIDEFPSQSTKNETIIKEMEHFGVISDITCYSKHLLITLIPYYFFLFFL